MPTVGDVLRFTSCAKLFDQDVCNIFYYTVAAWTGAVTWEELWNEFIDTVIDPITQIQSTDLAYTFIEIQDAMNPEDFYGNPYTATGGLSASPSMPSYTALGFKLVRTDHTTRNGFKRFAGVVESAIAGNLVTNPTAAAYTAVEDALAADLVVVGGGGGSATLAPAIVRMSPLDPYQVSEVNLIQSAELQLYVTTQNSRKVGHGN